MILKRAKEPSECLDCSCDHSFSNQEDLTLQGFTFSTEVLEAYIARLRLFVNKACLALSSTGFLAYVEYRQD